MSDLGFHPLANVFPLLDGAEFDALREDIQTHGLREPVLLYESVILDGRNRYRACQEAGVEPSFVAYGPREAYDIEYLDSLHDSTVRPRALISEDITADYLGPLDDPAAFVISLNLRRRHLNESQRAMVAAKLANMRQGERTDLSPIGEKYNPPVSQERASELLNVGKRSTERAADVQERAIPELAAAVDQGRVSVSAASEVARLPEEDQKAVVDAGPKAVRDTARDIRENGIVNRTSFTGNNEWFTPDAPLAAARSVLGAFDLDPASHPVAQERVQAERFFTAEDDGLAQEWHGRIWLNPPYAQPAIENFVDKMVSEVASGRVTAAIMLTHNYTDTAWFQKAAVAAQAICFTRGRVRFISPTGDLAAPTQGQAFFFYGHDVAAFRKGFRNVGLVVEVMP